MLTTQTFQPGILKATDIADLLSQLVPHIQTIFHVNSKNNSMSKAKHEWGQKTSYEPLTHYIEKLAHKWRPTWQFVVKLNTHPAAYMWIYYYIQVDSERADKYPHHMAHILGPKTRLVEWASAHRHHMHSIYVLVNLKIYQLWCRGVTIKRQVYTDWSNRIEYNRMNYKKKPK